VSINSEPAGGRPAPSSLPAARVPDGLPIVPMEAVSIHEMAKVPREQTAALKACGETLIRQQDQLTQIAQHVVVVRQSISPVDYGPSKGPNKVPGRGPATPIEGGHPGYTVKEMATLIHRSIWYVYRRVRSGEYAVTNSGRITHESYLKAMTRLAFIQKKQRRKKW
jgi:hypothetical protein